MSDMAQRNPVSASRLLADSLLRSVSSMTALLRVTGANVSSDQSEMGIAATNFIDVPVSPALMRKLRPAWQKDALCRWELLLSATSIAQQLGVLTIGSARELFAMTALVSIAGQDYLIESVSSNEAFGQAYLYRLLLRETSTKRV